LSLEMAQIGRMHRRACALLKRSRYAFSAQWTIGTTKAGEGERGLLEEEEEDPVGYIATTKVAEGPLGSKVVHLDTEDEVAVEEGQLTRLLHELPILSCIYMVLSIHTVVIMKDEAILNEAGHVKEARTHW